MSAFRKLGDFGKRIGADVERFVQEGRRAANDLGAPGGVNHHEGGWASKLQETAGRPDALLDGVGGKMIQRVRRPPAQWRTDRFIRGNGRARARARHATGVPARDSTSRYDDGNT